MFKIGLALFWLTSYMTDCSQNRDLKYNRIKIFTIFTLFKYFFMIPILPFEINNFLIYLVNLAFSFFSRKGQFNLFIIHESS